MLKSKLVNAATEVKSELNDLNTCLLETMEKDKNFKSMFLKSVQAKALLSINGGYIEKTCVAYTLSTTEDKINPLSLYMVSGCMQLAKMKRKGIIRTLTEDLSIGLLAAYLYKKQGEQA